MTGEQLLARATRAVKLFVQSHRVVGGATRRRAAGHSRRVVYFDKQLRAQRDYADKSR